MDAVVDRLILGDSPAIEAVRIRIRKVARAPLPVLIQGPTGSGKELVAQALHKASGRRGRLVAHNVCASTETMFEDTVFGHVAGAFTGARSDSPGLLAEADGGTLFLDEVGGLPMPFQAKLLRAVETREFRPIGGRGDRRSDFRLISATNQPLDGLITTGQFRRDFARRLSAVVINVPPLRDRPGDVPTLARHFLSRCPDDRAPYLSLSDEALDVLLEHDWPDNVRELRHVIECSALMLDTGYVIPGDAVVAAMDQRSDGTRRQLGAEAAERRELLSTLDACRWKMGASAAALGIHRTTLYRRMLRHGVEIPRSRVQVRADRPLAVRLVSECPPADVARGCATVQPADAALCNAADRCDSASDVSIIA